MQITPDDFKSLVNFEQHQNHVQQKLDQLVVAYQDGNPIPLLKFFNNYISWNGYFAGGVCGLTENISTARNLFRENSIAIDAVADRSNYVASFIYDAARDEFNSSSRIRDPHRSLAQAFLMRMIEIIGNDSPIEFNRILYESDDLQELNLCVMSGYNGASEHSTRQRIFYGMGYHAGSEILADAEFTMIDRFFKHQLTDFWKQLKGHLVTLHGSELNTFAWVAVHSGDGGGVEQNHFDLALVGIREALKFTPEAFHTACFEAIKKGFLAFARDHAYFFNLDVSYDNGI